MNESDNELDNLSLEMMKLEFVVTGVEDFVEEGHQFKKRINH